MPAAKKTAAGMLLPSHRFAVRMYRDAYDEVIEWGHKVRLRDRLLERRKAAAAAVTERQGELRTAAQKSAKETRDVDKLEGASITRALLSIVGSIEERLDKERAEAAAAHLDNERARVELELATAELQRLDNELAALADVDAQYNRAFAEKVARIVAEGGLEAQQAQALMANVTAAADLLREIDEALNAGMWALRYLVETQKDIKAVEEAEAAAVVAASSAIWMSAALTMSTPMPGAHRLEQNLKQAQVWLGRYATELNDLPGWNGAARTIASHGHLLSQFTGLVAGASTPQGKRARAAVDQARKSLAKVQSALQGARPHVVDQYEAAAARYRTQIENA